MPEGLPTSTYNCLVPPVPIIIDSYSRYTPGESILRSLKNPEQSSIWAKVEPTGLWNQNEMLIVDEFPAPIDDRIRSPITAPLRA